MRTFLWRNSFFRIKSIDYTNEAFYNFVYRKIVEISSTEIISREHGLKWLWQLSKGMCCTLDETICYR